MSCGPGCTMFSKREKIHASVWVAFTTFLCFLVIGSPFVFWLTSKMKLQTAVVCSLGPLQLGQSWWGWILHSVVAGCLGLGLGYAVMKPNEPAKCCCVHEPPS